MGVWEARKTYVLKMYLTESEIAFDVPNSSAVLHGKIVSISLKKKKKSA
jgi:hypothetical protein